MKSLYLAINNAGIHWKRPIAWTVAMSQFAILFGDQNTCPENQLTQNMRHSRMV